MNRAQRRAYAKENGVPMPPPDQPSGGIALQALPFTTNLRQADLPEGPRVLMVCQDPGGVRGYFFEPEHAKAVAAELHALATAAASGLTIVGDLGTPETNGETP